jgi:putative oxidoreductase
MGGEEAMMLNRALGRLEPQAYAALRIAAGLLFLFHGLQKIFGLYGGTAVSLLSQRGVAGIIELVGGTLIMIGLFTVPAAFIASGQMAVAYFQVHQPQAFWPIQNRGELAALYCFLFLYVATRGPGGFSVDRLTGWDRRK